MSINLNGPTLPCLHLLLRIRQLSLLSLKRELIYPVKGSIPANLLLSMTSSLILGNRSERDKRVSGARFKGRGVPSFMVPCVLLPL